MLQDNDQAQAPHLSHETYCKISDVLLQGRPLYDNLGDSRLFVTPTEWDAVMHAIDRRLNVMVIVALVFAVYLARRRAPTDAAQLG